MEVFTRFAIVIGCGVLLVLFVYFAEYLFHKIRYNRRVATLDNYDRTLSAKEEEYLEEASSSLMSAKHAAESYPGWYSWFLTLGFVPMFAIVAGAIFGLYQFIKYLVPQDTEVSNHQALITNSTGFGVSYLIFGFAILVFTAWILYGISLRSRQLSNYVALNSDIWGFDAEAVHARQLNLIHHKVRARHIKVEKPFEVESFLDDRNYSYKNGCLMWMFGLIGVGAIFLYFDLNYSRILYADRLESSGQYFSINKNITYLISDIDTAELNCVFDDGNPQSRYFLLQGGKEITSFKLNARNLEGLFQLDTALRIGGTKFKPHTLSKTGKATKNFLKKGCVEKLASKLSPHEDKVKLILHLDQGLPR